MGVCARGKLPLHAADEPVVFVPWQMRVELVVIPEARPLPDKLSNRLVGAGRSSLTLYLTPAPGTALRVYSRAHCHALGCGGVR
jgi:hypothetical protein